MNQLQLYEPHRLKYSQNNLLKIDLNVNHGITFESSQKYTSYLSNQLQNDKSNLLILGTVEPFENPLKIFVEFAPYERQIAFFSAQIVEHQKLINTFYLSL